MLHLVAYVVMAYVVITYVVMAYIGMACIVMAYIGMACIVMVVIAMMIAGCMMQRVRSVGVSRPHPTTTSTRLGSSSP